MARNNLQFTPLTRIGVAILASRVLVRRNNRTPPQHGFGRCPRGRSQPHRGLRQAHGEEDQCRREEGASRAPRHNNHSPDEGVSAGFLPQRIRRVDVTFAHAMARQTRVSPPRPMRAGFVDSFNGRMSIFGASRDRSTRSKRRDRAPPALSSHWLLANALKG